MSPDRKGSDWIASKFLQLNQRSHQRAASAWVCFTHPDETFDSAKWPNCRTPPAPAQQQKAILVPNARKPHSHPEGGEAIGPLITIGTRT
jgi:hypothetical protein